MATYLALNVAVLCVVLNDQCMATSGDCPEDNVAMLQSVTSVSSIRAASDRAASDMDLEASAMPDFRSQRPLPHSENLYALPTKGSDLHKKSSQARRLPATGADLIKVASAKKNSNLAKTAAERKSAPVTVEELSAREKEGLARLDAPDVLNAQLAKESESMLSFGSKIEIGVEGDVPNYRFHHKSAPHHSHHSHHSHPSYSAVHSLAVEEVTASSGEQEGSTPEGELAEQPLSEEGVANSAEVSVTPEGEVDNVGNGAGASTGPGAGTEESGSDGNDAEVREVAEGDPVREGASVPDRERIDDGIENVDAEDIPVDEVQADMNAEASSGDGSSEGAEAIVGNELPQGSAAEDAEVGDAPEEPDSVAGNSEDGRVATQDGAEMSNGDVDAVDVATSDVVGEGTQADDANEVGGEIAEDEPAPDAVAEEGDTDDTAVEHDVAESVDSEGADEDDAGAEQSGSEGSNGDGTDGEAATDDFTKGAKEAKEAENAADPEVQVRNEDDDAEHVAVDEGAEDGAEDGRSESKTTKDKATVEDDAANAPVSKADVDAAAKQEAEKGIDDPSDEADAAEEQGEGSDAKQGIPDPSDDAKDGEAPKTEAGADAAAKQMEGADAEQGIPDPSDDGDDRVASESNADAVAAAAGQGNGADAPAEQDDTNACCVDDLPDIEFAVHSVPQPIDDVTVAVAYTCYLGYKTPGPTQLDNWFYVCDVTNSDGWLCFNPLEDGPAQCLGANETCV